MKTKANTEAMSAERMGPLEMESPEWLAMGKALDAIYNSQDEAVQHFCKRRWEELAAELRRIELAAKRAQKVMKLTNA